MSLEIIHTNDIREARRLVGRGYEPIECAFGVESVLGRFKMDHHGKESHREGVAIRAYRDHYGALTKKPKFVVTGDADADATFAIASLSGLIPPRKFLLLAKAINHFDFTPFEKSKFRITRGIKNIIEVFEFLRSQARDGLTFYYGVGLWHKILNTQSLAIFEKLGEYSRHLTQRQIQKELKKAYYIAPSILVIKTKGERWLALRKEAYKRAAVNMSFNELSKTITVGVKDKTTAEKIFGKGGLLNIYPLLKGGKWGGREVVGGSPRGRKMEWADALAAAQKIAKLINVI